MKKYRLLFIGCILFNLLNAQQPSSRICASCIGGDGGGGEIGITCPVISTVLYVDASKASSGDGKSWGTAKKTLQEVLLYSAGWLQILNDHS
ncbi:MAG: hypothetical protein J0I84_23475 [Terrimonas sp.]|nr:hypothetical protein [Terrimonas sp.]OJY94034.1 MAG: hypothetical protein BGP13_02030 [Sphingobacteriales bacterium 40-81]